MKKITRHMPNLFRRSKIAVFAFVSVLLVTGGTWASIAHADQYDAQIQALKNQDSTTQSNLSSLQLQASSYQDAIAKLQQQMASLQSAIETNENKQVELQAEIDADQAKLDMQKKVLGEDLKAMYVNGSMSTMEMLASSKNLDAFVDAQTYAGAVQGKIQQTLTQIAALQTKLKDQQTQVSQLLAIQQQQKDQLSSDESQQNQLLAMNESQQNTYNQQLQSNQQQIQKLQQEQMAADAALMGGGHLVASGNCGGTYPESASSGIPGPWGCNYTHTPDNVPGCTYEDRWGMCNRECVSYAAWMVYSNYGINTTGFGNASQWIEKAQNAHIPTGSVPKKGAVAIYPGGGFGHAMWVTNYQNGVVTVSQFNAGDEDGTWSEYNYPQYPANGHPGWGSFTFIYFGE